MEEWKIGGLVNWNIGKLVDWDKARLDQGAASLVVK
jgi:hypothetical protein